nr:MAG TPA: 8.2 KDa protein [Caudoviricetes sp.]
MKKLIWNYAMAMAKLAEARHHDGNIPKAQHEAVMAWHAIKNASEGLGAPGPLHMAIQSYALAFARERLAYRFGVGETAATNIARIAAQRELFAQLAK